MTDYNGFSQRQRAAAQDWLRGEVRAGRRERPTSCCACGQDTGVLELHSEDYAQPWGAHVGRFPLCYCCHTMLHHRHSHPVAWNVYRARVRRGWRYPPAHRRDFTRYILPLLRRRSGPGASSHQPPAWQVLDEIAAGQHHPERASA